MGTAASKTDVSPPSKVTAEDLQWKYYCKTFREGDPDFPEDPEFPKKLEEATKECDYSGELSEESGTYVYYPGNPTKAKMWIGKYKCLNPGDLLCQQMGCAPGDGDLAPQCGPADAMQLFRSCVEGTWDRNGGDYEANQNTGNKGNTNNSQYGSHNGNGSTSDFWNGIGNNCDQVGSYADGGYNSLDHNGQNSHSGDDSGYNENGHNKECNNNHDSSDYYTNEYNNNSYSNRGYYGNGYKDNGYDNDRHIYKGYDKNGYNNNDHHDNAYRNHESANNSYDNSAYDGNAYNNIEDSRPGYDDGTHGYIDDDNDRNMTYQNGGTSGNGSVENAQYRTQGDDHYSDQRNNVNSGSPGKFGSGSSFRTNGRTQVTNSERLPNAVQNHCSPTKPRPGSNARINPLGNKRRPYQGNVENRRPDANSVRRTPPGNSNITGKYGQRNKVPLVKNSQRQSNEETDEFPGGVTAVHHSYTPQQEHAGNQYLANKMNEAVQVATGGQYAQHNLTHSLKRAIKSMPRANSRY